MSKVPTNRSFNILILTVIFVLFNYTSQAQKQNTEIRAAVDKLFEGMKTGDSVMVRSIFMKDNSFASISKNNMDSVIVRSEGNADGFIKAVGTPHKEISNERIHNVNISVDGPMAIVWAPYKFYRGETFSHCGVNVFTMIQTTTGWKIREITDTRRKDACP